MNTKAGVYGSFGQSLAFAAGFGFFVMPAMGVPAWLVIVLFFVLTFGGIALLLAALETACREGAKDHELWGARPR